MEKVIHISLNAVLFPLEEPAQLLLAEYLDAIHEAFAKEEGGQEIQKDIESRIAEHLKKLGDGPITTLQIQHIITIMGSVEELTNGAQTTSTKSEQKENEDAGEPVVLRTHKKLYRDIEHAYIGGVCAGIAAYLDTDPTWVRIVFVALIFIGMGSIIPIYLLLWLIVPPALTIAEKLDMHGDPVTLQSIAENVRKRIQELKAERRRHHHCHGDHCEHSKTSS
jgi:phage shock protein PspC (stress-responsive transcriptional regulator)